VKIPEITSVAVAEREDMLVNWREISFSGLDQSGAQRVEPRCNRAVPACQFVVISA